MNEHADISFIPNREVRAIPQGWQHPKDARGKYVPLLPEGAWQHDSGIPRDECMPDPDDDFEIAAYETTSEGTPISPAFPNTPEGRLALVRHCAEHETTFGNHRADGEAWAAVLFGNASIASDGTVRA